MLSCNPLIIETWNPEPELDLEIVVLVPVSPALPREFIKTTIGLAQRAAAPFKRCRIVLDSRGDSPPPKKPHPYRQACLAKIRQDMVDAQLQTADWVFWVDADIVDYPENLFAELVRRAAGGIASPVLLMAGQLGEGPDDAHGFGWGKFFDVAGFVEGDHWARFDEPWFDQPGPVYSLESVGGCYAVNAEIYRRGAQHLPDEQSLEFIREGLEWDAKTFLANQRGPANCFTEHYSVCQWARNNGYPVRAFRDLVARHAQI